MPLATVVAAFLLAACSTLPFGGSTSVEGGSEPLEDLTGRVAEATPTGAPAVTTTLRWAIPEPEGITPSTAADEEGQRIVDLLFDSLTALDDGGNASPALATRWVSQANAHRWVFTLSRQARFHDGRPVTAADVVRGWEAGVRAGRPYLHNVIGYGGLLTGRNDTLVGVSTPDDHTLVVQLSAPDVEFPLTVSHPLLGPMPADGDAGGATMPIGNGPFRMAEPWARGRFVRLTRTGPPPTPDGVREVVFRVSDPPTAYLRFQQARADIAPVPGGALASALEQYGAAEGIEAGVRTEPVPALVYLGINTAAAPWDDVEVRQALSMAIDRQAVVDAVGEGNVDAARSLVPPAVPGHVPNTCTACTYRPERARQIFAERGITSVTLTHEEGPGDAVLVEQLTEDLAAVGVRLETRPLAFAELLEALEEGRFTLYRFAWMTETPSAHSAVDPLVAAGPTAPGIGANYGRYADSEVSSLLARARITRDDDLRARLIERAERMALGRDQAVVPLFFPRSRLLVADRVDGFRLDPFSTDLSAVSIAGD